MQTVTNGFDTVISGNNEQGAALVEFEILDVDSNTDASETVTGEAYFSKSDQIYNQVRFMSGKYATLEEDYWLLDGSFTLPPRPEETGYEVGWWSEELSSTGGTFTNSQVVTSDFTINHNSIGVTITFDFNTNEYARDFTIEVYDSLSVLIDSVLIVGNTLSKYVWEKNLSNFRQIVITITKWKSANRRARITEIDFGIIKEYTDDDIIKLDVIEELDTINNQVSSNEMSFVINNLDKSFNILNPAGIYPYLQRKQKLKPYLGVYVGGTPEYVPMGVYYLTEWKSDEGTLTASFIARDILDILDQNTFISKTFTSKTLKYIIDELMTDNSITDYVVDSALSSIIVTGTLPEATYKSTLQTVCIAGQAVIYSDRFGCIQIKQLTNTASVSTIDFNLVYNIPQIKLNKLINTINVVYGSNLYTLVDVDKPADEQTLSVKIDNPLISTLSHAENVADWVLSEVKKRFLYDINWRQNPALESGDIVTVEDDFSENKSMRITKQEFNYQGYLGGKSTGKGAG
jgi:hypothetical protein